MTQISRAARTGLLIIAWIGFLSCPLLFAAGMFAPRTLAFLDPVVCPPGMQLDNHSYSTTDMEGNDVTAVDLICTAEGQPPVDATIKMLLALFGLPVLASIILIIRSRIPANPA
jgi:hypothetical protein